MTKPAPDPIYILQNQNKSSVNCLKYLRATPQQNLLAAGNQDGDLNLWDISIKRTATTKLNAHHKRSVAWIDQFEIFPEQLITTGRDGRLVFWSLDHTWKIIDEVPIYNFSFCKGCLIPRNLSSNPWIAVPFDNESTIEIIDVTSKKHVCKLSPPGINDQINKYGMCMTVSNIKDNENEILIGYENGTILFWDMRQQGIIDSIPTYTEMLMCTCCSSSGHGWSGSVSNQLTQWSVSQKTGFIQLPNIYLTNAGLNSLTLRKDEKLLATAGWDSKVRIFQAKNSKPLAVLSHHRKSIKDVAFSSDNYLAAASQDGSISLWDIYR